MVILRLDETDMIGFFKIGADMYWHYEWSHHIVSVYLFVLSYLNSFT